MHSAHPDPSPLSVSSAVQEGIVRPLSVLRATLESLAERLDGDSDHRATLEGVLDQFCSVARNVTDLAEFCVPGELHESPCSMEEIQRSAIRSLDESQRTRVWLALESESTPLSVDGAKLAHCIAILLHDALNDGHEEVLLHGLRDQSGDHFTIVADANAPHVLTPTSPPLHEINVVQLALARREIERMGGSISYSRTESGKPASRISFPRTRARQEVA